VYSKCISLLSSPVRYQASCCLHTLLYGGPTQVGTTPAGLNFRAILLAEGTCAELEVVL
jgi:hypothetical protein